MEQGLWLKEVGEEDNYYPCGTSLGLDDDYAFF